MRRAASRVLAGITSLAVGGVFVAASALGALADSPSPASLNVAVSGHSVTVSGSLDWSGKCPSKSAKAGFGIVWNDSGDVGLPAPGDPSRLVGLTGSPGAGSENDNNLVHATDANCGYSLTHNYVNWPPKEVCVIAYDYRDNVLTGFHSKYEGGPNGNTDDSILEPPKGGLNIICKAVVPQLSDVELHMSGAPSSVTAGDQITYTINVGNDGSKVQAATTQTQHLTVSLDANETFSTVSGNGWTNCQQHTAAHTVTCDYTPLLNKGAVAPPVTLVVTTLNNGESSVTTSAHVDNGTNSDDADTTNQDGSVRTPVTPQAPQGISIDKTATDHVMVSDTITYTMTVTNKSTVPTNGAITVTDAFPAAVAFQSASGTNWTCSGGQSLNCTWNGGALAAGASTTPITATAKALAAAVPSVTNVAHAHMGNLDVQDSATTIVNTPTNITLGKSADPPSGSDVNRGQDIVYTLHYANSGTTAATGAVITDPIPAGTTFVANSGSCTTTCTVNYDSTGNAVTFTLDVAAGSSGTASFTVTVNSTDVDGQQIDNQAHIDYGSSVIFSNITHHFVFVPTGDLTLTKSVSYTSPAKVGSVLTYKLVAAATGDIPQTLVTISDAIPDGTTYVGGSATCSTGCSSSLTNGELSWNVGTINAGSSMNVTFQVTVNGPAPDGTIPTEIVNLGYISSHETPKKPSNRVIVPLTTVLGTKIVKQTTTTTLPFTGLNTAQDALIALVLIGGGLLLLTWPRLQPQSRRTV